MMCVNTIPNTDVNCLNFNLFFNSSECTKKGKTLLRNINSLSARKYICNIAYFHFSGGTNAGTCANGYGVCCVCKCYNSIVL